MNYSNQNIIKSAVIKAAIIVFFAIIVSVTLGIILSQLNNMDKIEELLESKRPSLPSKLYDRNLKLISEFYSDEKRDLVTLDMIPEHLVQALIVWEDASFYQHHGFNPIAIMRAVVNNLLNKPISGASTITQQLARTLFLNQEFTIRRKLKELWIAFQLEKKYTKNEILTLYLNHAPLGFGLNGVQAASKFYFGKDIQHLTYGEAASIITMLSNPTYYSFTKKPANHKRKQRHVLKRMVKAGIITDKESEKTFDQFWLVWKTREDSARGAFFNRQDKAPFFSNWVINQIENKLPNVNVFKDGLRIYSTLDLNYQQYAEKLIQKVLERQQKVYEDYYKQSYEIIQNQYMDTISLIAQTFNLNQINIGNNRILKRGLVQYEKAINGPLNLTAQIFNLNLVDAKTEIFFNKKEKDATSMMAQVQGAFIVLDNKTGQILTMIGGKVFDPNHRFNYAMQGRRQPGSSFKPLIYSAAFDTGKFTAAQHLTDEPTVFTFDSEDPDDWYTPHNYGGNFNGSVSLRRALHRSLNIPACKVFLEIGKDDNYKSAIDRAALLLGINSQAEIDKRFSRELSTVLGTGSVSLIEMTTAFSVFANLGAKKIPNTILSIEDRDGNIIYSPWDELEKYYRQNKTRLQVISPQNAFLISNILQDTVHSGAGLLYPIKNRIIESGKQFPPVDLAAKTGTSQNFSDTWLLGFSPEITTGVWLGFKEYGISLGFNQAAINILGETWVEFMRKAHLGKGPVKFKYPGGLHRVQVCYDSGLLPSPDCPEDRLYYEYFLPGTVPKEECKICKMRQKQEKNAYDQFNDIYELKLKSSYINEIDTSIEVDATLLEKDNPKDKLDIDQSLFDLDLFENEEIPTFEDPNLNLNPIDSNQPDQSTDQTVNQTQPSNPAADQAMTDQTSDTNPVPTENNNADVTSD